MNTLFPVLKRLFPVLMASCLLLSVSCMTSDIVEGFNSIAPAESEDPVSVEEPSYVEFTVVPELGEMTEDEFNAYIRSLYADNLMLLTSELPELGQETIEEVAETIDEPLVESVSIQAEEIVSEPSADAVEVVDVVVESERTSTQTEQNNDGVVSRLLEGETPDFMTIVFCVLFLSTLFTLCYIAKQRKEARWHMFHD